VATLGWSRAAYVEFCEISEIFKYLDYDASARDLTADYSEADIAGTRLIYRCESGNGVYPRSPQPWEPEHFMLD